MDVDIDISGESNAFVIEEVNLDTLNLNIGGLTVILNDEQFDSLKVAVKEWCGLEAGMREIYEVWAGSEGLVTTTASEAYQTRLIEEMRDIAAKHLTL